jgi:adenylate kinase family enzyme
MNTPVAIASAASRDVLWLYQLTHVRRIRALLDARAAERRGVESGPLLYVFETVGNDLALLEQKHSIPFAELCGVLALPAWLRDALVLIAAPHLVDGVRGAIARFWDQPSRAHVDAALIVELQRSLEDVLPVAAALRDGGPLHAAGLIESVPISVGHTPSRLEHELIPTPRLLRILDGEIGLDPRFAAIARVLPTDVDAAVGVMTSAALPSVVELVTSTQNLASGSGARLLIAGSSGAGKLRLAQSLAAKIGKRFILSIESALLPSDPLRLGAILKALAQEAEILRAQLVLRRIDNFVTTSSLASIVRHSLTSTDSSAWFTSDVDPEKVEASYLNDLATLRESVALPNLEHRRQAWKAELKKLGATVADQDLLDVGADYPISRSAIETAARFATTHGSTSGPSRDALMRAAESQVAGQLARFAKRSRSAARLEHLVLTDYTGEQVNELVAALHRRTAVMDQWGLIDRHATGRGLVTLFNGPPGTGKTMCAAAISNTIGLPMYRIDVSNIVDRFVGETEKNLARLFEEAAASRAVLLFDEADSLFSKRVETKDSNDRYANMQVNLLLNLIEDYDGFVVLTTNLKGTLDDAFLRRIVYKIVFEMPEHDELVKLWEYHLPSTIPLAKDVNIRALAEEFDTIAGGDIKNAVLRAALAAGGERPVTREMLRRAMMTEIRANGGVVSDRR